MLISIKQPDLLTIKDEQNLVSYGGNQAWFHKTWARRAGCGATAAANITAYLAHTREKYNGLYAQESMTQSEFKRHMEELYRCVTPGPMGVNHVNKYVTGVLEFVKKRNVTLDVHVLGVDSLTKEERKEEELKSFVRHAISNDSPIAFLNLSRGDETRLQNWHWITITAVDIQEDSIMALASDEGEKREFNLLLWYRTTKMHGGLVYFI